MNSAYHSLQKNGIDTPVSQSVSQNAPKVQDILQRISTEPLNDKVCETRVNNIGLKLTVSEKLMRPNLQKTGLEVECHWLNCTAYGVKESARRSAICEIFGCDPSTVNHEANLKRFKGEQPWTGTMAGEFNQRVSWRRSQDNNQLWDISIQLPGQWFEARRGLGSTLKLMNKLDRLGFKPSRQDWALNDYQKHFKITDVLNAVVNCNFARFKSFHFHGSGNSEDSINGLTIDCGSRESDSMTRFYETSECHGYQANRIELELHGDKVKMLWDYLLIVYRGMLQDKGKGFDDPVPKNNEELIRCFANELAKIIIGQVEFVDKSEQWNNKSLKNCPRLNWWQNFIDLIGKGIKLSTPKLKPTLKTKGRWMKRQWARLLAILIQGLGTEITIQLIQSLTENGLNKIDMRDLSKDEQMYVNVLLRDGISALFE